MVKIEARYMEKKKGSSKFNIWALEQKTKVFNSEASAKAFAKMKGKQGTYVSLAWKR